MTLKRLRYLQPPGATDQVKQTMGEKSNSEAGHCFSRAYSSEHAPKSRDPSARGLEACNSKPGFDRFGNRLQRKPGEAERGKFPLCHTCFQKQREKRGTKPQKQAMDRNRRWGLSTLQTMIQVTSERLIRFHIRHLRDRNPFRSHHCTSAAHHRSSHLGALHQRLCPLPQRFEGTVCLSVMGSYPGAKRAKSCEFI